MRNNYQIRTFKEEDLKYGLDLAWNVFLEFVAPDYTYEGVDNFKQFIDYNSMLELYKNKTMDFWGCFDGDEIVGVMATRNTNHIALLFVNKSYHNQSIAADLFSKLTIYLKDFALVNRITVNASPYAINFYHKLGFLDLDNETNSNGMIFTPMEYFIN
ncbi:GNAT family N-acetyltransferase [Metaclostridioides mangenotii]|uniref:GNAT family N-acetyltransferase n=1 Tax=Metaclostridioides mangenotii TaxID=1540 RepID=UPI0028E1D086|nr:GNAT family N-acetyltransferase [Clostridioides mangenotii]